MHLGGNIKTKLLTAVILTKYIIVLFKCRDRHINKYTFAFTLTSFFIGLIKDLAKVRHRAKRN